MVLKRISILDMVSTEKNTFDKGIIPFYNSKINWLQLKSLFDRF